MGSGERLWRWCRRNPLVAALSAALVVAVVVGFPFVTVRWYAEAAERKRAEDNLARALKAKEVAETAAKEAKKSKEHAEDEAATARAVTEFLQNSLLAEAAPEKNPRGGRKVTVEELLDRAAKRIEGRFTERPVLEATLQETIGRTYYRLGQYAKARPHLERGLAACRRAHGEEHPDTLTAMNELAVLYQVPGAVR